MTNSALVNDAVVVSFTAEEALDSPGYVLGVGTSAGYVKKVAAGASRTDIVGIALTDTKDLSGTAQSGVKVGVIVQRGTIVYLKLASDNQAFSYGAPLCVDSATAGTVDYRDGTNETGDVIAIALEAKGVNDGGLVKALWIG